jgi:ArsR family transcriptional regulator
MNEIALIPARCCTPGARAIDLTAAAALAARFKALSDPTRVAMVNRLAGADEVCVCDLADDFELSQPTISHHLKILRTAGLVRSNKRGTWAYYRLVPEAIEALAAALAPVGAASEEPVAG